MRYSGGNTFTPAKPGDAGMTQHVGVGRTAHESDSDSSSREKDYNGKRPIRIRTDQFREEHSSGKTPYTEEDKIVTAKECGMSCFDRVNKVISERNKTASDKVGRGIALTGESVFARVKEALELAQNPVLGTAGQLAAQQPSPALPQVNELMTQLAMKQLQEEMNKSTEVNDPVEAENVSLRRQLENMRLKKELMEIQQEFAAAQGQAPMGAPPEAAMAGAPAEGGMPPEQEQAAAPPFEQALSPGQSM